MPRRPSLPRLVFSTQPDSDEIDLLQHASSSTSRISPSLTQAGNTTLSLTRLAPSSPIKPIPYPYTSTHRLSSTLRPRRRSANPLFALARRRVVHLALALSIPLLVIALIGELREHDSRRAVHASPAERSAREYELQSHDSRIVDLAELRRAYEKKRRRELLEARTSVNKPRGRRWWKRTSESPLEDTGWTLQDEEALRREVGDLWPDWWGSVEEIGTSPFDHLPAKWEVGKRRVLFLTDYSDYLERMNTHTYEIVDAALRHPHVQADVWGPGWAGYNSTLPVSVNVRRRQHRIDQLERSKREFERRVLAEKEERARIKFEFERKAWWWSWLGRQLPTDVNLVEERAAEQWEQPIWEDVADGCGMARFDFVWTISDIFKQWDPLVDVLDCGSLLVQQLGDCHSLRCMDEWYPHANNITLSKYAFELPEVFAYEKVKARFPEWEMGLFGHSPDTGNEWDFWPLPWRNKTSEATMFGYDGSFYPIRTTITGHLTFDTSIIQRHNHPGYFVDTPAAAGEYPLETYSPDHEYHTLHRNLREDFARGMRDAEICVFDASLERKMIRKYAQAFLSGCVVAADLPTEHEEALRRFVIPLKPTWDIDRIHLELEKYLAMPERLHQMAMDALVYARRHLTTTNKVSHVLKMADDHRRGVRGYELPHSFSLRCRAYWSEEDDYRPPWCREQGYRGLEG